MGKIIVAGIGPGSREDITPAVLEAVRSADAVVGYNEIQRPDESPVRQINQKEGMPWTPGAVAATAYRLGEEPGTGAA